MIVETFISGSTLWQKSFKICTDLCALDLSSPVAQFEVSPGGFKLQMKNKQTTYLVNITLKPGAFSTFPPEIDSKRFVIGIKNILKFFALFGKELTTQLDSVGQVVTAVTFKSDAPANVPLKFCAQTLQTRVTRVKITKDFEPVAKDLDAKTLYTYLSALDGSGHIVLNYDGDNVNFESISKTDSTLSKIGPELTERKQLSISFNKPLRLVLDFLSGHRCDLAYASNILKLTSQGEALSVELLLSIK